MNAPAKYYRIGNLNPSLTKAFCWLFLAMLTIGACQLRADTYKHLQSGEEFYGFSTQKTLRGLTRVYVAEESKFKPLDLDDYAVTYDHKGRRDSVIVIPLKLPEVLLSKTVSHEISKMIISASEKGPLFILLEIDLPGGRGDYMRDLCATIDNTRNCPIIAYIPGGQYNGVYSAAMGLALACDKIYMAPGAAEGSIPPVTKPGMSKKSQEQYIDQFSEMSLITYKSYVASLALKRNRPAVFAMAMLDRDIEVLEIADSNGKKSFIAQSEKVPSQTLVKTWTYSKKKAVEGYAGQSSETITTENSLTLSANNAIYCKMADGIAESRNNVLTLMQAKDAKLIKSGNIEKIIAKFNVNRREVTSILASIGYLEERSDLLNEELKEILQQRSQGTETRTRVSGARDTKKSEALTRYWNTRTQGRERVIIGYHNPNEQLLVRDLGAILYELTGLYRQLQGLATRNPGTLPSYVSISEIEKNADIAQVRLNNLRRF
jgi:membrane-bound ClpP family serine protease